MKKRASRLPNKAQIEKDLEIAKREAEALERNGQMSTYWHEKAARLEAVLKEAQGAEKKSEVNNGSSNKQ